jgi:hypothetical protein
LLCIFEIFGLVQRPEKYKENFDVSSEGPWNDLFGKGLSYEKNLLYVT